MPRVASVKTGRSPMGVESAQRRYWCKVFVRRETRAEHELPTEVLKGAGCAVVHEHLSNVTSATLPPALSVALFLTTSVHRIVSCSVFALPWSEEDLMRMFPKADKLEI